MRREHGLRLLGHLRIDEGRVVGLAELRPLLVHDLDVGAQLLDVLGEGLRHILPVGVVVGDGGDLLHVLPRGDDLGRRASFHRRVGGGAEDIRMQVLLSSQLIGLGDGRDQDDLVLLGDGRNSGTLGRGQRTHQELHLLLEDHLARHAHRLVGGGLAVAHDELDLLAEHAARRVDLVDEHARALDCGLAIEGGRSGQRHRHADLDGVLGCSRCDGQQRSHAREHPKRKTFHRFPPCDVIVDLIRLSVSPHRMSIGTEMANLTRPPPQTLPGWLGTVPAMRAEQHFDGRVVRCFDVRPKRTFALLSEAAAARPDGEAIVCGKRAADLPTIRADRRRVGERPGRPGRHARRPRRHIARQRNSLSRRRVRCAAAGGDRRADQHPRANSGIGLHARALRRQGAGARGGSGCSAPSHLGDAAAAASHCSVARRTARRSGSGRGQSTRGGTSR